MRLGQTGKVEGGGGAVDHSWHFINYKFKDCYSGSTESIRGFYQSMFPFIRVLG